MKMSLFLTILALCFLSAVTRAEMAPMVIRAPSTKPESREQLAQDIIVGLGLDQKMGASFEETHQMLKRLLTAENSKSNQIHLKTLQRVQARFEKEREELKKKAMDQLVSDFARNFTESELKYLKDSTKYPVFVRFSSFLDSKEYGEAMNFAPTKVSEFLREARIEVLKEEKKVGK